MDAAEFSGIGLMGGCASPSVFLLKFDLCKVAANSFCSLETTGPFASSSVPFLSLRGCCDRKSNLEGCLASPSYAPILMATFPLAGFKFCAFGAGGGGIVFGVSDTGLVDSFPLTCGLFPVGVCRGLPFVVGTEFWK